MNASNLTGGAIAGSNVADGDQFYLFHVSASGIARTKSLTRKEARRAFGDEFNAQTWSAGSSLTVTPGDYVQHHLEELTITLSAGSYVLTVADGTSSTRFAGNRTELLLKLPGTAGISIAIKNGAGTTLATVADDGSGDDALVELYHNGTTWKAKRATYPTNV
jgi:hypothetical protein